MITEQEMREAFEEPYLPTKCELNEHGKYINRMMEAAWLGYVRCYQEQLQRIDKLEAYYEATISFMEEEQTKQQQRVGNSKATSVFTMGEREALKFAHVIQRETLQRAVEICEEMSDSLQSSDCTDCAEAIKKEMKGL